MKSTPTTKSEPRIRGFCTYDDDDYQPPPAQTGPEFTRWGVLDWFHIAVVVLFYGLVTAGFLRAFLYFSMS